MLDELEPRLARPEKIKEREGHEKGQQRSGERGDAGPPLRQQEHQDASRQGKDDQDGKKGNVIHGHVRALRQGRR
jgi:hypothetical protein